MGDSYFSLSIEERERLYQSFRQRLLSELKLETVDGVRVKVMLDNERAEINIRGKLIGT